MKLIPFEPHHFYMVEGREERLINDADGWAIRLQYERSFYPRLDGSTGRSAGTVLHNDIPICCFGAFLLHGVASVWMRVAADPPVFIYRLIKRGLNQFLDESGVRRAETVIAMGKTLNHKFIRKLGFNIEGLAANYFPDNVAGVRWAWVRK